MFLFCNVKHVLSLRWTVEGGVELSKECRLLHGLKDNGRKFLNRNLYFITKTEELDYK